MGKAAKTVAQKVGQKQAAEKPKHRIVGGVCRGYTVVTPEGESIKTYEMMWDAIDHRNFLNGADELTRTESRLKFA